MVKFHIRYLLSQTILYKLYMKNHNCNLISHFEVGLTLSLGHLGHCLSPLLQKGPKFGGQFFFFWEMLKKNLVYIFFLTIKKAQRIK